MATKEVETIVRRRMVKRQDVAEYEQRGWKFSGNRGSQSALMEKIEKVKAAVVLSAKEEKPKEEKPKE